MSAALVSRVSLCVVITHRNAGDWEIEILNNLIVLLAFVPVLFIAFLHGVQQDPVQGVQQL